MRCPRCNAELQGNAKFCSTCGTPLAQGQTIPMPTQSMGSQGASPYAQTQPGYTQPMGAQGASPYGQQPQGAYRQQAPGVYQQPYGGAQPTQTGVYTDANAPSNAPFVLAIVALICSFFIWPLGLILGIVALATNSGQKKRGEVSTKQGPTTIMGIISIVISTLCLVFIIVASIIFGSLFWEAVQTGNYEILVDGDKVTVTKTDDEGGSSSSSTESSSGSAAIVVPPASSSSSTSSPSSSSSSSAAPSSSSSSNAADASSNAIVGTWKLVGGTTGAESLDPDDLEMMEEMGLTVTFVAKSDGSATLDMFGESMSGTWSAVSGTSFTILIEGNSIQANLSGSTLTMHEDSEELIFEKI